MKTYIGYAKDENLRWRATSGGVGSAILRYLFDTKQVQTALAFDYDEKSLQYVPKLIYSYEEYQPVGSIYHEIDLPRFIKSNLDKIKGAFACFCLPCQAKTIRYYVQSAGHVCFVIGLVCSSQQSFEATEYLLKRIHVRKEEVACIQYRGNGWPSGIQIRLKNGSEKFVPNGNSLWTQIFHSRLFVMPRCLRCKNTLNTYADISIADPWLREYMNTEKKGKTLLFINRDGILSKNISEYVCLDSIDEHIAVSSQKGTLKRKKMYEERKLVRTILLFLNKNKLYKLMVKQIPLLFLLHCRMKSYLER